MLIQLVWENKEHWLEIEPSAEINEFKEMMEIETGIPAAEQVLIHASGEWRSGSLQSTGLGPGATITIRRATYSPDNAESFRQRMLQDPNLLAQLNQRDPALVQAARGNPAHFAELFKRMYNKKRQNVEEQNIDAIDPEMQKRIENEIRHRIIMENYQDAMENNPESFGKVHMLYVDVIVNGYPIKGFVDSGAQATIMSSECAKKCK